MSVKISNESSNDGGIISCDFEVELPDGGAESTDIYKEGTEILNSITKD
jgi:hypothetical protein